MWDGLWRGEIKCIGPKAKDADMWILILEEVHTLHKECTLLEAEHVKAHRSKKETQEMTIFDRIVAEGSEREEMAQLRASTVQQRTEEGVRGSAVCSLISLFRGGVARLGRTETKAERSIDSGGQNRRS